MPPFNLRALRQHLAQLRILAAVAAASLPSVAQAEPAVDVQLVIAADVSTSMDKEEKELQQQGFVEAFRNPELIRTILSGPAARISVTYIEWGGNRAPKVVVPWTVIDSPASALAFAQRLDANFPARMPRGTALGMILEYASYLLQSSGFEARRSVINVSGDGVNNTQPDLAGARAAALEAGATINGMPIVYKGLLEGVLDGAENDFPPEYLVDYFETEVIGGPGAFVEPVTSRQNYANAIMRKLVREIGGNNVSIGFSQPAAPGGKTTTAASAPPVPPPPAERS